MEFSKFDIVFIGHITKDRLIGEKGDEVISPGGAVYYGSLPATTFNLKIAIFTKLAKGDENLLEELKRHNITVFPKYCKSTTVIKSKPKTKDQERRYFFVESLADPFTYEELLNINPKVIIICPLIYGEFPKEAIPKLSKNSKIGLDVQGFIRRREGNTLRSHKWEDKEEYLKYITYLKADNREVEILTNETDIEKGIKELAKLGPKEILVTTNKGIYLWYENRLEFEEYRVKKVVGRTGRGDTAFASYVSARFSMDPKKALIKAVEIVSKKLEKVGPYLG